ncbi:hypothetical protein IFR05_009532 [Cadophora sp. M221]|nr:hypothetical protein IFR05_009532 [Cadophora sp. M221]
MILYQSSQNWLRDTKPNSTQAELSDILATANRVKQAFLDPDSVSSLLPASITRSSSQKRSTSHFHRSPTNSTVTSPAFTNSTLEEARAIVRLAQKEANVRNKDRIDNPRVNNYYGKESSKLALKLRAEDAQLLSINATVAAAAAMVAEADATHSNTTEKDYTIPIDIGRHEKRNLEKRAGSYWLENMNHVGRIPFGGSDNDNYPIFRNVKDYGAVGNGKVDDTAAINRAMTDGNRCGAKCGASSIKGAVVYFPAGMFSLRNLPATQRPILIAAKSFVGLGLLSSDHYTGNNGGAEEWYINQNNFYRQVRNFIIDLRDADMVDIAGIHWQVAQATSIQDVSFFGSNTAGKSHMGIFAENGSGGFMSDLTFIGGAIGMRCGNQQFTTRNFVFFQCKIAIDMLWDWGWTWKSLYISGADIGIKMSGDYIGGSVLLLDSSMFSTNVGISISTPHGSTTTQEQFSVTLDNLYLEKVTTLIVDKLSSLNVPGGSKTITSWVLGKVYDENSPFGKWSGGGPLSSLHPKTESLTDGTGAYLERSKPQYADIPAATFINAKITLKGDGVSDDTFGLNLLLSVAAGANRPLFIPMGSYIVTDTIKIPLGSRVVGECWSQIVAQGAAFVFVDKPHVMVQVGDEGDAGVIEIQDLLFTSTAPSAGVILMEWNVAQTTPGSAAMWDSHFRIGGAKGSKLQREHCPKLTGTVNERCIAGSMLLHLTSQSSAYMENIWAWVSDHDIDSSEDQTQIDVYVSRGILIESQGPTWLYGTSSEHCVLYQYQLFDAKDIFLGMVGLFNGDPDFSDCNAVTSPHCAVSWGLRIVGSKNIHIAGAGLYNWFQAYIQPCVDAQDCAQRVVQILGSSVWLYNLYTIGTVEMINTRSGTPVLAKDNTNKKEHPFTSIVNAWLLSSSAGDDIDDDEPYVPDPPCSGIYRNVTQVMAAVANIPDHCLDKYLVDAEIATINDSLDKYTETISKGYDSKFNIYAEHIKQLVPLQLIAYMAGAQASGFFTCTTAAYQLCCGSTCCAAEDHCICPAVPCNNSKDCQKGVQTKTVACPTSIPDGNDQALVGRITYTCTNVDGFKADVAKKYGIDPSWIVFGDYTARRNGGCWQGNCNAVQSKIVVLHLTIAALQMGARPRSVLALL